MAVSARSERRVGITACPRGVAFPSFHPLHGLAGVLFDNRLACHFSRKSLAGEVIRELDDLPDHPAVDGDGLRPAGVARITRPLAQTRLERLVVKTAHANG